MSAKILVVHDQVSLLEQLSEAIVGLGFEVLTATTSDEAGPLIRIHRPNLLLLDGSLVLSDLAVCRRLRQFSPETHLPVILLIPQSSASLSRFLCGSDADDYLCQPFDFNEFEARIMLRLSADNRKTPRLPQIDYSFLRHLSSLPVSNLTSTQILQQVVNAVAKVVDVSRCSVTMTRQDESAYVMASSDDPGVNGLQIELARYPEIRDAIETGRPLVVDNVLEDPLLDPVRPYLTSVNFNSILVLPMTDRERVLGVLVLRSKRSISGFSEEEVAFCQLVANVATSALRLAEASSFERKVKVTFDGQCALTKPAAEQASLLDMAAHDLRVLVSVIDGYCTLFAESADGSLDPEQERIIEGLMAGNRRLVDMANDLLDYSHLSSGAFELNLAEHDLCHILASVCGEVLPLLQRRRIQLKTDCLQQELPVVCDEHGIRRVFYNIVSNAMKFTPEGGTIRLDLAAEGGEARISIEDNGPGIAPQQVAQLFDEFTTISPSDPRSGNGLGLSICKKIIEAHHGRIWAESFLGQGSRFTFCLPQ